MNHAVMSRRKSEATSDSRAKGQSAKISLSDSFQELMYMQFMNLNVSYIIYERLGLLS